MNDLRRAGGRDARLRPQHARAPARSTLLVHGLARARLAPGHFAAAAARRRERRASATVITAEALSTISKDFNRMADQTSLSKERGALQPDAEEYAAIPLVEERLSVAKRQVESGRVRVRVTVEERAETITEQLARDDVEIERVPRGERLSEMPHVRLEGSTTIIPVVEEVLVVEKALVLVEEIHVRRRTEVETVEIPATVRRERASVEREDARQPSED
jgi:uncharacterized protein (TIGR02271 family)